MGGGWHRLAARIRRLLQGGHPAQPEFGPDAAYPVRKRRGIAEAPADVLPADQPHRHLPARAGREGRAEHRLQHENAFAVVAKRPVPEVGHKLPELADLVDNVPLDDGCVMA